MGRSFLSKPAIAVIILLLSGLVLFLALPHIINRLLLPPLLQQLPFSHSQAAVSTITTSSARGSIELEHEQQMVVSIPVITISYSPASLLKAKAKTLTIEQGHFHLYFKDGKFQIPGIQGRTAGSGLSSPAIALPAGIDLVKLRQCRMVLHAADKAVVTIGIDGEITPSFRSSNGGLLDSIKASLSLSEDIVAGVTLSAALGDQQIRIQSSIRDAQAPALQRFLPEPLQHIKFSALNAAVDMSGDDFSFRTLDYQMSGMLSDFSYVRDGVTISAGSDSGELRFSLSGNRNDHRYEFSSILVDAPLQADITMNGEAHFDSRRLRTAGTLKAKLGFAEQADSSPLPAVIHFDGSWTDPEGLRLEARSDIEPKTTLRIPGQFTAKPTDIELTGVRLAAELEAHAETLQARMNLRSGSINLKNGSVAAEAGALLLNGSLERNQARLNGRVDGSLGRLMLPEQKISINGLQFDVPVAAVGALSGEDNRQSGTIAIDAVAVNGADVASLSAALELSGVGYRFDGSLKSPVVPDGRIRFSGTALPFQPAASLSWELAPLALDGAAVEAVGIMTPDIELEGRLEAHGEMKLRGSHLSGWMRTSIDDGAVQLHDNSFTAEGIDCAIEFPELPRLVSGPSQRCTVSRAAIASLSFDDAEFIFRLEDPPALFIERSTLSWCGGTLDSGSLRLEKDIPELDAVFYASQINLGRLLEQFGFKISEGEGSLNGRLPLRISRESIEFDGGFLFSTPGTGGIVRFTDTELLRQGIGGVSEAGSIGYALQALEDFSYNWTKLSFNTSGNELLLALELDGKPRTALPFKLNKNGTIVESKKGAGIQYPIRLDVNVRLPLEELFRVGQSFNSIMENNQ